VRPRQHLADFGQYREPTSVLLAAPASCIQRKTCQEYRGPAGDSRPANLSQHTPHNGMAGGNGGEYCIAPVSSCTNNSTDCASPAAGCHSLTATGRWSSTGLSQFLSDSVLNQYMNNSSQCGKVENRYTTLLSAPQEGMLGGCAVRRPSNLLAVAAHCNALTRCCHSRCLFSERHTAYQSSVPAYCQQRPIQVQHHRIEAQYQVRHSGSTILKTASLLPHRHASTRAPKYSTAHHGQTPIAPWYKPWVFRDRHMFRCQPISPAVQYTRATSTAPGQQCALHGTFQAKQSRLARVQRPAVEARRCGAQSAMMAAE
jgi:hypothetical protein